MQISVEATVQDVTVYPDRARVVMGGECELQTGLHQLVVPELPLILEPESIRAAGRGTAQVRLLSVDVGRQYYEQTPAEKVQDLERQIEQVKDELRVLADREAGWKAHAKYLDGLREATVEFAKGLSRGRTTVEDQTKLIQFLQAQDAELRTAVHDLEKQKRDLDRRLFKLQQTYDQLQSSRPRQRYQAQVEIEVLQAGSFLLELSYVVRQAGWQPLYDVRLLNLETEETTLEVSYIAQVTQNTGQDWPDVNLVVSTARPALSQRLPELNPWYVDVYMPRPAPQAARAKMSRGAAAVTAMQQAESVEEMTLSGAVDMLDAPAPAAAAEVATASVQQSGTAVSFAVSGSTDIPSDGSPHKTTISQFHLDPKLDYLAVPKHTDAVYRRATVVNTSSGPFLPGNASLFVGDEFIGRTQLEYTPAGGEFELLLGVESLITIERELVKREVDKKRLRDKRQLRYGYEIELKNLLAEKANVEVHDHIPVARHEQIKVKLEQTQPQPDEQTDLNLLEWHLTIAAGEEQAVQYEYLVEYPRTLRVVGLQE